MGYGHTLQLQLIVGEGCEIPLLPSDEHIARLRAWPREVAAWW